jgi:glutamyl-tRNA(Gln) amidotransferase subunit E
MKKNIDPQKNYQKTQKEIGYVARKDASQKDYDRIGFMSGLEVHQQLDTVQKLFCRCPAGQFNSFDEHDAELIRHMRPTLSELGEYDGTALMEFKTKKNITYRIKNETACTYDIDDTPPFPINKQALEQAIIISLLSKQNIVGEVHVARKQYLDGSIPTGFQRTAIIGIDGEIQLKNKIVKLIQLSIEEDSCREISDIGHDRVYQTDRLGTPLIETVTHPELDNPDEVKEACDYIRFLNRSTGLVRTGIGASRQDVNVSCKGGTRVEIKGVSHTKWIPELTHNECFRQWALLNVKKELNKRVKDSSSWKISNIDLEYSELASEFEPLKEAKKKGYSLIAINLPKFKGLLSHFTQPSFVYADEIKGRLKVIACLERPFMTTSEDLDPIVSKKTMAKIAENLNAEEYDAQIIIWGPKEDMPTALETIEERCQMAFEGIPNETRKCYSNGTTRFERVLPGADRMYPDTDTPPTPLKNSYIEELRKRLPSDVSDRVKQMQKWEIPEDTFTYILSRNLYLIIEKIIKNHKIDAKFVGTIFGHTLKRAEGKYKSAAKFDYNSVSGLFKFVKQKGLDLEIVKKMIPILYQHPKMEFESILTQTGYKKTDKENITATIPSLKKKYQAEKKYDRPEDEINWIMGQLRNTAIGNMKLAELKKSI